MVIIQKVFCNNGTNLHAHADAKLDGKIVRPRRFDRSPTGDFQAVLGHLHMVEDVVGYSIREFVRACQPSPWAGMQLQGTQGWLK